MFMLIYVACITVNPIIQMYLFKNTAPALYWEFLLRLNSHIQTPQPRTTTCRTHKLTNIILTLVIVYNLSSVFTTCYLNKV